MSSFLRDLRQAIRSLSKQPAFLAVALLTLALGIGATSAVFTALDAVVLRPLPYPEPAELVMVFEQNLERGWVWYTVSPANFLDWREQADLFEGVAAYSLYTDTGYNLTGGAEPERVVTTAVSAGFFEIFGVRPMLGRTFLAEEDVPGRDQVVVLSHGLWQRRFGGDAAIVGRQVLLDGVGHQVIGVMGPEFRHPDTAELWMPIAFDEQQRANRTVRSLFTVARLRDGVSLANAQARMSALATQLEKQYPESNSGFGVVIHGLHDRVVGGVRPALFALMGAVACLLLITCANAASLMLARAAGRGREIALRQALGASRRRLAAQLLAEGLVLALAGGVLGLALAAFANLALKAAAPAHLPRLDEIGIDLRVVAFTLVIAVGTALLFTLAPLARLRRANPGDALRAGLRGASLDRQGARLRSTIVGAQVALALILLTAAGLTGKSLLRLQKQDLGFEAEGLLSLQLSLPRTKYPSPGDLGLFYAEVLARASALPGVESAAVTSWLPFASVPVEFDFYPLGKPPEKLDDAVAAGFRSISPGYFRTLGIPLVAGRDFSDADRKDSPGAVIINQTMAKRFWPQGSPLGERIVLGELVRHLLPGLPLEAEVVGIVGDVKQTALALATTPEMYVPYAQYPLDNVFLLVRGNGDPSALLGSVRNQIATMDAAQPIYDPRPMANRVEASIAGPKLTVALLLGFALVSLALAAIGVYGVIAYSMSQRRREIGLRMALGAEAGDILRWVVVRGLVPPALGLGAGFALALVLGRLVKSMLFEVQANDPLVFFLGASALLLVSFLAALLPALRSSRIDPQDALRDD